MEFWEVIKTRRSIRKFDPKKNVSEEQLDKILEAAVWAPSSGNTQCWRFFAVRDKNVKNELANKAGHQPFINDASILIVVCADLDEIARSYGERGRNTYSIQDTSVAIENMLLATTSLGLASCWVGAFDEGRAAKILKLDNNIRPLAMIPIGYAAESPIPPARRSLKEVVIKI
ncbi:MAG: nitroreductase family protein [Deltaproteobacteria bacterium]|nr:nitroreductase family protein [Deltaproteobacteria bacterium]